MTASGTSHDNGHWIEYSSPPTAPSFLPALPTQLSVPFLIAILSTSSESLSPSPWSGQTLSHIIELTEPILESLPKTQASIADDLPTGSE